MTIHAGLSGTCYRPAPHEWNGRDAMPDEDEVLHCLDELLDIRRREGPGGVLAVQVLHRFDLLSRRLGADWRRRLAPEPLRLAGAWFAGRIDAVAAKHRVLGPLVPAWKSVEVFPWVACAICGARPDGCNPLPGGWSWDTDEESDHWAWCPEHSS